LQPPIQLVIGLGNPGPHYQATRHNAGAWLIELIAQQHHVSLQLEPKFQARIGRISVKGQNVWLLIPNSFMNKSGWPVKLITQFYKIPAKHILLAHDELDFPPGVVRFKQNGGHGGHNGVQDVIHHLGDANFYRLRIGIGHPGDRDQVINYVLNPPSQSEYEQIISSLNKVTSVLPTFLSGNFQQAIQQLHSSGEDETIAAKR
jgi:peptidyl-tRNA hydrolase, PTH1 family